MHELNEPESIYRSPHSLLDEGPDTPSTHWFWKVFFWINALLVPLIFAMPFLLENLSIFDYLDQAAWLISLLALFAFAHSKRLFSRRFWRYYAVFYLLWSLYYAGLAPYLLKLETYGQVSEPDLWSLIDPVFILPTVFCMFLYSRPTNPVWFKKPAVQN